ncbi:MAG TPA: hypothetical protein VFZ53_07625 [Polyangiaceae bacterium]
MKLAIALIGSTFLALASTACSAESPDEEGGGGSCSSALVADPVNNYSFSSTLSFPPVSVMPNAELTFDWSAVTKDLVGHDVNPVADIDAVNLMLWELSHDDLQRKLNDDDLRQTDLAVIATYYTNDMATSANIFQFTSVGMELTRCNIWPFLQLPNPDPNAHPECDGWAENTMGGGFDPTLNTYTIMAATGTTLGAGTRMIQAFRLDPSSTNTQVFVKPDSTKLEYTVDLRSLKKTSVPTGQAEITIDWTGMTTNALGNEFVPSDITQALVAHYMQPVSELEANFLDLDVMPADRWRATIDAGSTANLASFTGENGAPFPGIDGKGTWVLALICGDCRNPAPWYLTILEPCN